MTNFLVFIPRSVSDPTLRKNRVQSLPKNTWTVTKPKYLEPDPNSNASTPRNLDPLFTWPRCMDNVNYVKLMSVPPSGGLLSYRDDIKEISGILWHRGIFW